MARTKQSAKEDSARSARSIRAPPPASAPAAVNRPAPSGNASRTARKQSASQPDRGVATDSDSSNEEDSDDDNAPTVAKQSQATRASALPPSSRVTRQRSSSDHAGDEREQPKNKKQRNSNGSSSHRRDSGNNGIEDDDEDDNAGPSQKRTTTAHPAASTSRTTRSAGGKTLPGANKSTKVLKAMKNELEKRKRKTGFVASRRTGATSGEDNDDDDNNAVLEHAQDDDDDDDTDDSDHVRQTRSLSIVGFNWKAQDITIKAKDVVGSLKYVRSRCFLMKVKKQANLKDVGERGQISSLSEASDTEDDDPNIVIKKQTYERGQLVYFLPDPAWLEPPENGATRTVEDLDPEDWWLGLVLDCVDYTYPDGDIASVLRVAWCYSRDQAVELFSKFPNSEYAKQLENHDWLDGEMLASDHVDFVGADSAAGEYLSTAGGASSDSPGKRGAYARKNQKARLLNLSFIIRGLEKSDFERTDDKAPEKTAAPKMWLQPLRQEELKNVIKRWALVLSHDARVKTRGIPTETARTTTAMHDEGFLSAKRKTSQIGGGKGKGKGKGRGKGGKK